MTPRWRLGLVGLWLSLALSGCASVFLVDNQVQSFARWGEGAEAVPASPQSYRFDRLPSQSGADTQDTLERLATEALASVGWTPAPEGNPAPWLVQISANTVTLPRAPWESAPSPWRRGDRVVTADGKVHYMPRFMDIESPFYQRKVSVVIREAASGRVVYETHAAHDGRWIGSEPLWGAMLHAALQGFPQPPQGPSQVNVEVPH